MERKRRNGINLTEGKRNIINALVILRLLKIYKML